MASVTADTSLPERALLTALNPTLETKSENLTVSLYCERSPCVNLGPPGTGYM
jgi:hypothetical protein